MHDAASWRNGPDDGGARIGAVVGGWAIERLLGRGPVCDSWLAARGDRRAVVRRLRAPYRDDPAARLEWVRASWSASRFHHARVVKVLEQAVDGDGVPVIVRAFSRGEPLQDVVRRAALDVARALRLAEHLLDVLEMAHAHGIVHGALTPTNVLVTPRGSVRVMDFATTPGRLDRRTGASDLLATARLGPFVAPERRARPVAPAGEQADVWAVGACLHLALGGRAPPADARPLPANVGEDVAAVVAMALAPDPLQRYESAYAMLGDVRRLLAGRKPRLGGSLAPVPSQSAPQLPALAAEPPSSPPSSSGMRSVDGPPASTAETPRPASREWLGNVLLVLAIALLVALATYVVVRERLGDGRGASLRTDAAPSPAAASRSPSQAST
jgi:serine/threonine protein kinase